jgi:putative endonuclease
VADFLVAHGYALIGRNVRVGALELDLVAQKGDLVAVVEVRTRGPGSYASALASVDATKRASLVRAAHRYWREHLAKRPDVARLRFDVAAVAFEADSSGASVEYIEAAFTA